MSRNLSGEIKEEMDKKNSLTKSKAIEWDAATTYPAGRSPDEYFRRSGA